MLSDYPPLSRDSTQLLLLRHGQSTYNAAGLFQGCSDLPELTAKGVLAAEDSGRHLRQAGISTIVSSPLRRAVDTASRIADAMQNGHKVRVHVDERLREVDLPSWEGLPVPVLRDRFPSQFTAWEKHPHLFRMSDDRQPLAELYAAANDFWRRGLSGYAGQRVLVVAHSGSCRALISTALGMSPRYFHSLQCSNCGLSLLEFRAGAQPAVRLRALNVTTHLGESLPKLKAGRCGLRVILRSASASSVDLEHVLETTKPDLMVSAGLQIDYELPARMKRIRPDLPVEMWSARKLLSLPPGEMSQTEVSTVLVLSDEWVIQHLILNVLGLSPDSLSCLHLRPEDLTVIHYSRPGHRPIVQAMNLPIKYQAVSRETRCYVRQAF